MSQQYGVLASQEYAIPEFHQWLRESCVARLTSFDRLAGWCY